MPYTTLIDPNEIYSDPSFFFQFEEPTPADFKTDPSLYLKYLQNTKKASSICSPKSRAMDKIHSTRKGESLNKTGQNCFVEFSRMKDRTDDWMAKPEGSRMAQSMLNITGKDAHQRSFYYQTNQTRTLN